jgi:hypothetical protein
MSDVGIDDSFIQSVCEKLTPGTSALFAMTTNAVSDRVLESFRGTNAELISTNLSVRHRHLPERGTRNGPTTARTSRRRSTTQPAGQPACHGPADQESRADASSSA